MQTMKASDQFAARRWLFELWLIDPQKAEALAAQATQKSGEKKADPQALKKLADAIGKNWDAHFHRTEEVRKRYEEARAARRLPPRDLSLCHLLPKKAIARARLVARIKEAHGADVDADATADATADADVDVDPDDGK